MYNHKGKLQVADEPYMAKTGALSLSYSRSLTLRFLKLKIKVSEK